MKWSDRAMRGLYICLRKHGVLVRPNVRRDLERLYPGEDIETLCRDYYIRKFKKSMLLFFAGSALAVLLALRASSERKLEQDGMLKRGTVAEESRNVTVETVIGDSRERFQIRMEPQQLSEEEITACYREFTGKLPQLIAGDNPSLREVTHDLDLRERYEGYPFSVEWRSGDVDCITSDGKVRRDREEREVELRAWIEYGEQEWRSSLTVMVQAEELTSAQRQRQDLTDELLASEAQSRMSEYWILPDSLNGVSLRWRRVVKDNSLIVWAGALMFGVMIYILEDRDLHEKIRKQKDVIRREYPDIVHKLALYLGAGMTLQGAFGKMASEYEQRRAEGIPPNPAYEELVFTCRELKSGVSESKAYEHFGKRIGLQEYIRLSTLMAQNLKRGSDSLLPRLREEADNSLSEQIRAGKKLGEEASTKLLLPMVMMLAVVMVMVILPAFGSLGL